MALVSQHARREKSVRHGHPSTLHLWWARQPLASSRAVLLGLLLPDPSDANCPDRFRIAARAILHDVLDTSDSGGGDDKALRNAMLRFIGDIASWDRFGDTKYLAAARALIRAAHGAPPRMVDPFAGGGSMPLEALRLGCTSHAAELNPVACLILKAMLQDVPRYGNELAAATREAGATIRATAERKSGEFYPVDADGAQPIAYLWARTVRCELTDCGAEIPLVRTFWLAQSASRPRALRIFVERSAEVPPRLRCEVFAPATEAEVPHGTVSQARATCVCCERVLAPDRVRAQLRRATRRRRRRV